MTVIEAVAVAFGVAAVWMIARENVWGWPTGVVNAVLFAVVFVEARLYAAAGLQVVYVCLSCYGWYAWRRGGHGEVPLRVARVPTRALLALVAGGAVLAGLLGLALHRHTDASLPFLDSASTACSLVAQWMQTRKWIENWIVWIGVDVVYVGTYVYKGLYLTSGLYAVFLALALAGWRYWRRSLMAPALA